MVVALVALSLPCLITLGSSPSSDLPNRWNVDTFREVAITEIRRRATLAALAEATRRPDERVSAKKASTHLNGSTAPCGDEERRMLARRVSGAYSISSGVPMAALASCAKAGPRRMRATMTARMAPAAGPST